MSISTPHNINYANLAPSVMPLDNLGAEKLGTENNGIPKMSTGTTYAKSLLQVQDLKLGQIRDLLVQLTIILMSWYGAIYGKP